MADDAELRRLYALLPPATEEHPDDAVWAGVAEARISNADRERLFDHVAKCGECAAVYKALELLRAEANAIDPGAPRKQAAPWSSRATNARNWAGLAAAAAVVVWIVARPAPTVPAPEPDETRAGGVARPDAVSPAGPLARLPSEFRWSVVAGARSYRVRLLGPDGTLLWTSTPTKETRTGWPADLRLAPGHYLWQAVADDGSASPPLAGPLTAFDYGPTTSSPR
jgi:ferric-dicitrate binding protein FerR (iron transport regulator)